MKARLLAIFWTLIISCGSLMPKASFGKSSFLDIPYFDKVLHASAYFGFVFLWSYAFKNHRDEKKIGYVILGSSVLFGILIELGQLYFSKGRHFEVLDIIANIIGSIIGLIAFYKFLKHK